MPDPLTFRAEQAAAVLQNPLFQETFTTLDARLVALWREEPDPVRRDELFFQQQALASVRTGLLEHLDRAATAAARKGERGSAWRKLWEALK